MNANELAEGINSPHNACCYRDKCRQQQAEIASLQKNLDVALMIVNEPAKTLTDEEIYQIAMEVQTGFFPQDDTLEFARAILRKASEK